MYSYRHYTPGARSDNTSRIITYTAEYNARHGLSSPCYCIPGKFDKNTPGSDSASARVSYASRISQVIQTSQGGKTQYGDFYLGKPLSVNYLGRVEGMPGGSGMPPVNRF
jgi:hypothetical protein